MSTPKNKRPIIFTDDAWIIGHKPPLTPEIVQEKMIDPMKGLPAALWWSIGDHEVYHWETKIGEIVGSGYDISELDEGTRTAAENVNSLTQIAGGPLKVLVDQCKKAGIEFFPRVRMNSHYAYHMPPYADGFTPKYGKFRQEHPDLLIGRPGELIPEDCIDWDIRTGKDYAYAEVRDYMYAIITELFETLDVDGVEMDFNRHPAFFRREEAYQNRYLMTDLVKKVRERMKQVGSDRNRNIELAVRVPPTLDDSERIGLEVSKWIQEGLVDTVVAGVGWIPFEMPIAEFVDEAKGSNCQIYGCLEGLRPLVDDNALRAAAYRMWNAGTDGIYMYNYFTMSTEWKKRMLPQLADPVKLEHMNKRYELDHSDRINYGGHGGAFRNAVPAAQLPVTLERTLTGKGAVLKLEIADNLENAIKENRLGHCTLGLIVENFGPNDSLETSINGKTLPVENCRSSTIANGAKWPLMTSTVGLQYDLESPPLRSGVNKLEIGLTRVKDGIPNTEEASKGTDGWLDGNEKSENTPILKGVEITITYI